VELVVFALNVGESDGAFDVVAEDDDSMDSDEFDADALEDGVFFSSFFFFAVL